MINFVKLHSSFIACTDYGDYCSVCK